MTVSVSQAMTRATALRFPLSCILHSLRSAAGTVLNAIAYIRKTFANRLASTSRSTRYGLAQSTTSRADNASYGVGQTANLRCV